jgi:DNA-binding NarL/FixJ family response regulator
MNQHQIDKYQDTYRKAWSLQNQIDARTNKMVISGAQPKKASHQTNTKTAQINGRLGGRPRTGNNIPLSGKAKVINYMLKSGLTAASIAEMLEVTVKSVEGAIQRYGMPRDE